jgi:hypothetical protein
MTHEAQLKLGDGQRTATLCSFTSLWIYFGRIGLCLAGKAIPNARDGFDKILPRLVLTQSFPKRENILRDGGFFHKGFAPHQPLEFLAANDSSGIEHQDPKGIQCLPRQHDRLIAMQKLPLLHIQPERIEGKLFGARFVHRVCAVVRDDTPAV